ncbi:MAG: secretin N-terminal domain-containing protein, partial [Planctomycetota bacterium]|nr:secretin N-terminal domain-containing protein [Planctomycetota bacterium]
MIETRQRVRRPSRLAALAVAGTLLSPLSWVAAQETSAPPIGDVPQVRFNFKGQSWDQVLDYFSRASGLPIVRSVEVPQGTVDYFHPSPYPLPKALETLNILLQTRGVMLRQDDGRLVLEGLDESKRVNVPTFVGELPSEVTPDTVVTLVVPLINATAAGVAEQLKAMVGEYGMLVALPEQNSILVVETAANVRRLRLIVDELDREDVENAIEQIQLVNASATELLPVLEKLMSERVVKTVVQNKKPVQVVEDVMPAGFRITADARTNTIIGRGTPSRIERLREAVAMLDTPKVGSVRQMRTLQLERLTVADARRKLDELFAGLPENQRPTYVVLADTNRLTISAEPGVIDQATQFIADLESGGSLGPAADQSTVALLPLSFASPEAAIVAVRAVLNPRQLAVVRIVPGPDGRSLVVARPGADVDGGGRPLGRVDRPARADRQVRYLAIEATDPALAVERAIAMHAASTGENPGAAVESSFDEPSRTLVIEGSVDALDRFEEALEAASASIVPESSVRQFTIAATEPSRLVAPLRSLAASMLRPRDGGEFVPPAFEAVDPLGILVVEASREQFPIIDELIRTLDRPQPGDLAFRVIPIGDLDGESLLARSLEAFDRQLAMLPEGELARPEVRIDAGTGSLEVLGSARSVELFERSLAEARRLVPPPTVGRLIEVRQVRAEDIVEDLRTMVATAVDFGGGRRPAEPVIEVITPTNSLWIRGDEVQVRALEGFVKQLDVFEPSDMPPLRMLQLAGSDATQIARLLAERYDARPTDVRREQPVRIEADAATNTLVVTASTPVFEEIRDFVESLNRNSDAETERETMIFPLRLARATDLAKALATLYPEPPMPLDSRGRPLPHLRQPREVFVSADAGTNTLIVEAPGSRRTSFEELVSQLDRIELPPQAELRTWDVSRGEGDQIADTLEALANEGVLSRPGANGEKAVEVMVRFEPRSRTLIVAGDAFTFEKVEEILADLQAVPVARSLQVIEIAAGDVTEIADRAGRLYSEQTDDDPDFSAVEVEVDVVNGTILAVGEQASLARFTQVVRQLESAQARPPDVRLLSLAHADATETAEILEELIGNELSRAVLGGSPPAIEPLVAVNALLVAAQPREHDIIVSVVETLDVAEEALPPVRILQVRTADAQNLARALSETYDRRSSETRAEKPVRVTADVATNSLIVAAHPDMLDEIRTIVMDLNDADRMDAEGREIRIFPLRVARAEDLAQTIDQMYPEPPMPLDFRGRPRPDLREPREVVVRANPQMNALIVDAPNQRMAGFEKLVEQLDQAQIVAESEIRTWKIPGVELDAAARTLRELAAAGHLGATDAGVTISVSIDAASDTLIVSGPATIFDRVDSVIESLRAGPLVPSTSLRTFRLVQARADALAPMLREVLVARIREDLPGGASEVDRLLTVTADRKTNTLIISAPDVVMPIAEQLVLTLDASASAIGDPTVRVRPLSFAEATIVAGALQQAIPSMTSRATGEPVDVKVVPASGSNALLLVGLPEDIEEVETLIAPLDSRPALDAIDARTFELVHADAGRIAPVVQKLLADQQDADPRLLMERIRRSRGMIELAPKVRVEADDRTNSLIVSGPAQTVTLAEGLIAQLDRPDADDARTYATFTPRQADPKAILGTAQKILDDTRPAGVRSTLELVLEPQSGSIMIIGSEEETARATALLRSWDDAVPALPP